MIDSYIILNRKSNKVIRFFILNISILIIIFIWRNNTLNYKNFFHIHSKIINFNSYFVLEVLIPVKEVNQIKNQNQLFIGNKKYNYTIYKISNGVTYQKKINYQKIYLEVIDLENIYKINNYRLDIKIPKET